MSVAAAGISASAGGGSVGRSSGGGDNSAVIATMLACGLGLGGGSGGRGPVAGSRCSGARVGGRASAARLRPDVGLDGQESSVVGIISHVIADLKGIVVSTRQVPGDSPGERTTVGSASCSWLALCTIPIYIFEALVTHQRQSIGPEGCRKVPGGASG